MWVVTFSVLGLGVAPAQPPCHRAPPPPPGPRGSLFRPLLFSSCLVASDTACVLTACRCTPLPQPLPELENSDLLTEAPLGSLIGTSNLTCEKLNCSSPKSLCSSPHPSKWQLPSFGLPETVGVAGPLLSPSPASALSGSPVGSLPENASRLPALPLLPSGLSHCHHSPEPLPWPANWPPCFPTTPSLTLFATQQLKYVIGSCHSSAWSPPITSCVPWLKPESLPGLTKGCTFWLLVNAGLTRYHPIPRSLCPVPGDFLEPSRCADASDLCPHCAPECRLGCFSSWKLTGLAASLFPDPQIRCLLSREPFPDRCLPPAPRPP